MMPYGESAERIRKALADGQGVTGTTVQPPTIKILIALSTYGLVGPTGHTEVCQWLNGFPADIWRLVIVMDNDAAWPSTGQDLQAKLAAIYGDITDQKILPHIATPTTLSDVVMEGVMTLLAVCPDIPL
jgi:hypothetical protein